MTFSFDDPSLRGGGRRAWVAEFCKAAIPPFAPTEPIYRVGATSGRSPDTIEAARAVYLDYGREVVLTALDQRRVHVT